jgi:hypothetical protein
MTKEQAIQVVDKNIDLIDKNVTYENTIFKLKRLLIDQIELNNYMVKASIEKQSGITVKGVELVIDFADIADNAFFD